MISKSESKHPLYGSIDNAEADTNNKTDGKDLPRSSNELTDVETLGSGEMFDELVQLDYLEPAKDNSQLVMPTAYKTVPTVTTIRSSRYAMHDED